MSAPEPGPPRALPAVEGSPNMASTAGGPAGSRSSVDGSPNMASTTGGPAGSPSLVEATVVYRARFDECGPDGHARASAFLRWAQDAAWIHSERHGLDRGWYRSHDLAWLVRAAELTLSSPVETASDVAVTTCVVGWRHVLARRRTEFRGRAGDLLAYALTDWVMTDETGVPTRIPRVIASRFEVPMPAFTPIRVTTGDPSPGSFSTRFTVRPHELDPMDHVNNAAYLDYVDDALEAAGIGGSTARPLRYRLEYVAAAGRADDLEARAWIAGGQVRLLITSAARDDGCASDVLRAIVDRQA